MMLEAGLLCLAMNVYFEARSEPVEGQWAVAEVTVRRARQRGQTLCEVVFAPKQFSWTEHASTLRIRDPKAWQLAQAVAKLATISPLNWSNSADHFHTVDVKPYWSRILCKTTKIGAHIFYRECRCTSPRLLYAARMAAKPATSASIPATDHVDGREDLVRVSAQMP